MDCLLFQLNLDVLLTAADHCYNLEMLDVAGQRCITDELLRTLARNCPKLHRIGMKGCAQVLKSKFQLTLRGHRTPKGVNS